jgi:predicted nucleotidyltransferase
MKSQKDILKSPAFSKLLKPTTEDPELADRFNRVLGQTVEAMEEASIRYLFIGGIASGGLGRPRSTQDIDLFVMPEEAELAVRALAKKGFRTEKTDPSWLYKGFKENILVDVIFKSKGEIYLDAEMYRRMITAEFHGKNLKLVAPEDLLIIKAAAHSELTPGHWHDATALVSHANLDWDYLIRRARRAPRRVLSLLLYAQSNDLWVPNSVIHELYMSIFGDQRGERRAQPQQSYVQATSFQQVAPVVPHPAMQSHGAYGAAHLRECLAEDPRTNELDIEIEQAGNSILLRGEVTLSERRDAVETIARECFPNAAIENQIRVMKVSEASGTEEMK